MTTPEPTPARPAGPGAGLVAPGTCAQCPTPSDIVDEALSRRVLLEDARPVEVSLDWELGQLYYKERGHSAFLSGDVPYAIHNDGYLSLNAAELLFTALAAAERQAPLPPEIRVLELGAGCGLFARYFLDHFRELCHRHRTDYYDRLRYVVTDGSARMLEDLGNSGLLQAHQSQHELRLLSVEAPDFLKPLDTGNGTRQFQAVFLNYFLDNLPATLVRRGPAGLERLYVRTWISRGARLEDYTLLPVAEIVQAVQSADPGQRATLIDIYPVLQMDFEFRRGAGRERDLPFHDVIDALCAEPGQPVLHSYGAIHCLDELLPRLASGGFVLISDYVQDERGNDALTPYQRFGGATCIGVNLALLKRYYDGRDGAAWLEPRDGNEQVPVRLLGRDLDPATANQFVVRFGKELHDWAHQPVVLARQRIREGRRDSALAHFREALTRQPHNWTICVEAAQLLLQCHEVESALEMAEHALRLNPVSPEAWNTLGDAYWATNRPDEAHRAFQQALHLFPQDVRARHNLVYTLARRGDLAGALHMVAEAFVLDQRGEFRERLLERQAEILQRLQDRSVLSGRMMANRCLP